MNSNFCIICTLIALSAFTAVSAREYRVLVAGDGMLEPEIVRHLDSLASAGGHVVSLTVLKDVGELRSAVKRHGWDAVVLSREAASKVRRVRTERLFVHQDWAYATNYRGEPCVDPQFRKYGQDQQRMYRQITDEVRSSCVRLNASALPVGTAVQDIRATQDRDNITRDGVHLNHSIGCFVAAGVWYESITGDEVRTSSYTPQHIHALRLAMCRDAVHCAIEHPWEVVDFGYRSLKKNYDESRVPHYVLPDPLVMSDGTPVTSPEQWYAERRPELYHLFETEMYGKAPGRPADLHFEIVSVDDGVFGGTAIRKEVRIYFTAGKDSYMTLLLYLPKQVQGPVPVILGANFDGNASVIYDTGISLPDSLQIQRYSLYREPVRGSRDGRWPVGMILSRGYGLATFFKGDLDPEWDDGFSNGVHPLFYRQGQTFPDPDEWGAIGAWAWGYSRALDYLETDKDVDAERVSTIGHSRLAKTALWAAVSDTRFAMAYPNNSGCCGAAISRRAYGETLETMIIHYHYWYCQNFWKYAGHEDLLPFDQHELIALMAPRPVYVASGEYDRWSDPVGEFLSVSEASKVYEFLGLKGVGTCEMPGPWTPLHDGLIGYHMRSGPHDITTYDWAQFLDFCDRYL